MERNSERTECIDALLTQARSGSVEVEVSTSVLEAFPSSDAVVFERILHLVNNTRLGLRDEVLSAAPNAIRDLGEIETESAQSLWVAFTALGIAHFRTHQYLSALHWYEQAQEVATTWGLEREVQSAAINAGLALRGLGDAERALGQLYSVVLDPKTMLTNRGAAHLFLAHIYADQGELEHELHHLRESVRGDGDLRVLEARSMLARGLARRGNVAEARTILDSSNLGPLTDQTPFDWCYYLAAHGETLTGEGRVAEALLAFRAALAKLDASGPDIPIALVQLGRVRALIAHKRFAEALEALQTLTPQTMSIADSRDYFTLHILVCTNLGHVADALRSASDRVRLVDQRMSSKSVLEAVRNQLERTSEIARQSRVSQEPPSQPSSPALAALLDKPLGSVRAIALQRQVSVRLVDRTAGLQVAVQPEALDGPLRTLLWNAVRFNCPTGVVEVQLLRSEQFAHIRIVGTGSGWSPELAPPEVRGDGYGDERYAAEMSLINRPEPIPFDLAEGGLRSNSVSGNSSALGRAFVEVEFVGCRVTGFSSGLGSGAAFTLEIPILQPTDLLPEHLDLRDPE